MAITDAQKVDLLYKKIGFGVAKTDTSAFKSPSNEANASPLLTRGDSIWQSSGDIPAVIPVSNTAIIALYTDATVSTIEATLDTSVSGTNRTWLTNLQDWIPAEFGPSYQVKVYAAPTGNATPQTSGTQLFADGSGSSDAWYFDYAAGILNFPDTNVPSAVAGKKIYISGARYVGPKGIASLGNISANTISVSSLTTGNANIYGGNVTGIINLSTSNAYIAGGNITANIVGNVTGTFASFSGNINSNWLVANSAQLNNSLFVANTTITAGNIKLDDIKIVGNTISSLTTDIVISANTANPNNIIRLESVSAFEIPTGSTSQRPPSPERGYLRYNTTVDTIEWYNGNTWTPAQNVISSEVITTDGVNSVFALTQNATTGGILVNINGTIQQALSGAYSVSGNQITFAETPLVTDVIEIRYLSTAVTALDWDGGNVAFSANFQDGTSSTSTSTGAVTIVGGLGVGGNLYIANTGDVSANIGRLFLANTVINSNLGAYQTYANANAAVQSVNIDSINANLGAMQTSANARSYTFSILFGG
jgi:hypothetical protein